MAKKRKKSMQTRIMMAIAIVMAVLFLPTTALFVVGMLPTIVARVIDRTPEKTKVLTVGFMNFAGVFPFWYQLVEIGHKFDNAMALVSQPLTVVVMYAGAVLGYALEWGITGFVASMMVQKGRSRLDNIKKAQEAMVRQWGPEVSGEIPLNQYGFPLENK